MSVIQYGRTDTSQWALIAHPDKPALRYRLSQRWLQDTPAEAPDVLGRKSLELPVDYFRLVKLVHFISEKLITINELHCINTSQTLGNKHTSTHRINSDDSSPADLGATSPKTTQVVELETSGSRDPEGGER